MYEEKLQELISEGLSKNTVKTFDEFIKNETTFMERRNISFNKFLITTNMNRKEAEKLFNTCVDIGLFKTSHYFSCPCGEHYRLSEGDTDTECPTCYEVYDLREESDRVAIHYKLVFPVE